MLCKQSSILACKAVQKHEGNIWSATCPLYTESAEEMLYVVHPLDYNAIDSKT